MCRCGRLPRAISFLAGGDVAEHFVCVVGALSERKDAAWKAAALCRTALKQLQTYES
jgi:hypothetical protein